MNLRGSRRANRTHVASLPHSGLFDFQGRIDGKPEVRQTPEGETRVWGKVQDVKNQAERSTDHAGRMRKLVDDLVTTGNYSDIVLNRNMRNATGLAGTDGNVRPDIVAIRRDGRVDTIEVQSGRQSVTGLMHNLEQAQNFLPPQFRAAKWIVRSFR